MTPFKNNEINNINYNNNYDHIIPEKISPTKKYNE
jgi:hypothetical protein